MGNYQLHKTFPDGEYIGNLKNNKRHDPNGIMISKINNKNYVYMGKWEDGKFTGYGSFEYPSGNIYEGEWNNDKAHGKGKMIYANGDVYEGEWNNNKAHGKGKMIYANGDVYEGDWGGCDTTLSKGVWKYANGDVYEGCFKNEKKEGVGKMTDKDGYTYEGKWDNDKFTGWRKWKYDNGVFEGEFINDKQGKGISKFNNGDVFEGDWGGCDTTLSKGVWKYANGDVYEGCFKNEKKEGVGKMTDKDGYTYEGKWDNDKFTGWRKWKYDNGIYEGDFVNDKAHGYGISKFNNGDVFEGDLKDGTIYKGKWKYVNGDVYEGDLNGKYKHGHGKITYKECDVINGCSSTGKWVNNKKDKLHYVVALDGTILEQTWDNGILLKMEVASVSIQLNKHTVKHLEAFEVKNKEYPELSKLKEQILSFPPPTAPMYNEEVVKEVVKPIKKVIKEVVKEPVKKPIKGPIKELEMIIVEPIKEVVKEVEPIKEVVKESEIVEPYIVEPVINYYHPVYDLPDVPTTDLTINKKEDVFIQDADLCGIIY